jgi:ubiquinone/menaquinone biosynthesis C-methylase UbiE
VLLAQITAVAGTVAKNVHHREGTGSKTARYGPPVPTRLADALDELFSLVLALVSHYDLQDAVHAIIRDDYDRYRRAGYLSDERDPSSPGQGHTTVSPIVSGYSSIRRGVSQYAGVAQRYRTSSRRSFAADCYRDLLLNWAGLSDRYSVIVDIGCGEGTFTDFLQDTFPSAGTIVGIDASDDMIRLARNDYPTIDFRVEDMSSLSLPDAAADLVCSRFAVHYSDDLDHTLAEIGRVTMAGGVFVFEDAHPFYATFLKSSLDYERKEDVSFPVLSDDELFVVHPSFTFEEYLNSFTRTGWSLRAIREVYGRHSSGPRVAPRRVPTSVCFVLDKK